MIHKINKNNISSITDQFITIANLLHNDLFFIERCL